MNSRLFWTIIALLGVMASIVVAYGVLGNSLNLPTGRYPALVILGIWLAVLIASLVGSRMNIGHMARTLGLWFLIFLTLIAAFQYRYELQDILHRITAGLVPGSPLSITDEDGTVVLLEKSPNGHFEARGAVNGVAVQFLIDTGASSTVLTVEDAQRAGYDLQTLVYNIPISTANGPARAARVVAKDIAIGAIVRTNLPVFVAEQGMLEQSLLGMNFIGTLSGFDVRGDRMILRD